MLRVAADVVGVALLLYGLNGMGVPVARVTSWPLALMRRLGIELTPQLVVGALLFMALALALGTVIGSGLLGVYHWNMRYERLPGFFWALRGYPPAMWALAKGTAIACVPLGVLLLILLRSGTKLHGEARWARRPEIGRAGLLGKEGILLARIGGKDLRLAGTEHVLVEAPTQSGKGVGVVIPNLLEWCGSAFILDVKQENWDHTAGFRSAELKQAVYLFDPLNYEGRTARYNPLGHIDRTDPVRVIDEVQKIAAMLYPEPAGGDPFWNNRAQQAFIGIAAYVAAVAELPFTIGEVYRQAERNDAQAFFARIAEKGEAMGHRLSGPCCTALSGYASMPATTFGGVKGNMTAALGLWVNPNVDAATSASDFDLSRIRKEAMSIYLGVSPDDIERVRPLYNLMAQQIIDLNVRTLFGKNGNKVPVLMMLDEFARLGRSTVMAQAFSYVAGYGLRLVPIIQDRAQLRAIYGPDVAKEIMSNCGVELIFGVKEESISAELERRIGYYTYKATGRSRKMWEHFQGSVSTSDQRRALMMAQEIREMPTTDALLFRANTPPMRVKKIRYYEEAEYVRRSKIAAPALQTAGAPRGRAPASPDVSSDDSGERLEQIFGRRTSATSRPRDT